jgi:rSAM/selenodomain-associated transferase 2
MKISLIIPVFNETALIVQNLSALQSFRAAGHELILVDGGGDDTAIPLSKPFVDQTIQSPKGRSRQMNNGAKAASGEILLFLHIDTLLPEGADQLIVTGMERERKKWGRFDVRLSGRNFLLRIIEWLMNMRSRITGIATGDQAIFVQKKVFEIVGGFPDIDLMEDITLSKFLKKCGPPLCLWHQVITSSRRWEEKGILRTILLMWFLRGAYFLGMNPKYLARLYDSATRPSPSKTVS